MSPANNTTVQSAAVNLRVTIDDQNQPVQQVKVLVNGRSVGREELRGLRGTRDITVHETSIEISNNQKNVNLEFPLSLDPERNIIEVLAYNGYSWSTRSSVSVFNESVQQAVLPSLWILAIGVNQYASSSIGDLNYCVRDAQEFVNVFKQQEGIRYAAINSLFVLRGLIPRPLGRLKKVLNPEYKYLMRTTYPVPLG
jgi:hypothetical protein